MAIPATFLKESLIYHGRLLKKFLEYQELSDLSNTQFIKLMLRFGKTFDRLRRSRYTANESQNRAESNEAHPYEGD
jgi:hypothetical protein